MVGDLPGRRSNGDHHSEYVKECEQVWKAYTRALIEEPHRGTCACWLDYVMYA